MNIQEAKEEIIHTVKAYTEKREDGSYCIPRIRQRPLLLMGPPGIGKTAVMAQAASECGIGLVSYTMTHHTRQSAVGLPLIEKRIFGGKEYTVTEYTMSEMIASVYESMEITGKKEGILFLDEINCVSETLAPTMLQFLQNKAFGCHLVPEGWVLAAAGNPREYNKSVRDFDMVTLDRVRQITIEPDLPSWQNYARKEGVHPSIRSYLSCRPDHFYYIDPDLETKRFVTARGWEDLSVLLKSYENMNLPITRSFLMEFLPCGEIADDFYSYYQTMEKLKNQSFLDALFGETFSQEKAASFPELIKNWQMDERFSCIQWISSRLLSLMEDWEKERRILTLLENLMQTFWRIRKEAPGTSPLAALETFLKEQERAFQIQLKLGTLKTSEQEQKKAALLFLQDSLSSLKGHRVRSEEEMKEQLNRHLKGKQNLLLQKEKQILILLERILPLFETAFSSQEEQALFFTELASHEGGKSFITACNVPLWEKIQAFLQTDLWDQQLASVISSL